MARNTLQRYHSFIKDYTYKKEEDDRMIHDLIAFTENCMENSAEVLFDFERFGSHLNVHIITNRIEYGQMIAYHHHDYYEMSYVFNDKVYEIINGEVVVLDEGDVLLMHPDAFHSLYPNPCAKACNFMIEKTFAESIAKRFSEAARDNFFSFVAEKKAYVVLNTAAEPAVKELAGSIHGFQIDTYKNSPENLYKEAEFMLLLNTLLLAERDGRIERTRYAFSNYGNRAREMIDYITTNFATVTVNDICRRFHYSRTQTYRLLIKHTGYHFKEYITMLRLQHAKHLLRTTDLAVKEVGRMVGMEESAFQRFFKSESGITPLQFRKGSE